MLKQTPDITNQDENLPIWDLGDLYASPQDPQIEKDLEVLGKSCSEFKSNYQGKLGALDGQALARSIQTLEEIDEKTSKLATYSGLLFEINLEDQKIGQFVQYIREKLTDMSSDLIFYTIELAQIPKSAWDKLFASPELTYYKPWIDVVLLYKDHMLSDEMERLLNDKSVVGRSAWNRLFDETINGIKFPYKDQKLNCSQIFNLMTDRDEPTRHLASISIGETLKENSKLFAMVTNTLAKEKEIEDRWRKYPNMLRSRNLSNQVEDEIVEALTDTVKRNYPNLSHRYYALKAKWLGSDKLNYWDRNAPLFQDKDDLISWGECKDVVYEAYQEFSPLMGQIVHEFFSKPWIDAKVRDGKTHGAFAHPAVPSVHPYILVNYLGKTRDVMTVAHELGHGIHQTLAGKAQGHFKSQTPLTLAETASVFGEMLTFQKLLERKTTPEQKKILMASKIEDMLSTVVRQIAFFEFEKKVHAARRKKELTVDEISEFWMQVQSESLGPALKFDENYKYWWSYIPHFIHTPFYVYAYAFGDCLVNSLYSLYSHEYQGDKHNDFAQKYITLLSKGGSELHRDLLKPFGLDASKPEFWQKGLNMISGMISELEAL